MMDAVKELVNWRYLLIEEKAPKFSNIKIIMQHIKIIKAPESQTSGQKASESQALRAKGS